MVVQEKMATIGQLAAGIAHEVNNPAGFIGSNLGTLQKYISKIKEGLHIIDQNLYAIEPLDLREAIKRQRKKLKLDLILEDIDDLISESKDGIDRIATIVRNLKSFSRSDDEKFELIDLNNCLNTSLNIAWNEIKYVAKVEKDFAHLPFVNCLPQQISQVFINLFVNAAHACDNGGIINIETKHIDNWAIVTINDNGCGIDEDILPYIFTPFFSTKKSGKGTGLGLSICHDIILKHQGLITVESTPGQGTTFSVSLPL